MLSGVAVLGLAGCAAISSGAAVSLPPAGAPAPVVLDAYLRALVAGDCRTAHALVTPSFSIGNGELCHAVKVSAFSLRGGGTTVGAHEVVYSAVLTTGGSSDGTIAPGRTLWFYDLKRRDGQ